MPRPPTMRWTGSKPGRSVRELACLKESKGETKRRKKKKTQWLSLSLSLSRLFNLQTFTYLKFIRIQLVGKRERTKQMIPRGVGFPKLIEWLSRGQSRHSTFSSTKSGKTHALRADNCLFERMVGWRYNSLNCSFVRVTDIARLRGGMFGWGLRVVSSCSWL